MLETSPELIARAVNARPVTSRQGLLERLFNLSFSGFVYNQIWEDPDVDAQALRLDADSRIMTISSGGCNVLNYLLHGVASIDAVDLNANHLHLLKLKLKGLAHMPTHEDFFTFFGNTQVEENVGRYITCLRPHLDDVDRQYWEGGKTRKRLNRERFRLFERGLWKRSSMGMFLRFMNGVARRNGMCPARILESTTIAQQEAIFNKEIAPFFELRAVKSLAKLPFFLHGLGVPPRQYEAFEKDAVAGGVMAEYRLRVKRLACHFPIQNNYFVWQAFGSRYDTQYRQAIPSYLKAENFSRLGTHANRVKTHLTSMTGFLATLPAGSLNRFVLLDAQDWMTSDQITALWRQIARVGQGGARIIFRSGAAGSPVEAALPSDLRGRFTYHPALSRQLFEQDRSAIYGGFHLYTMD